MKKLKIAVIGVGSISSVHIEAYQNDVRCDLYAFCDIDEKTLKEKGAKYGVTRLYTDFNEMFKALPELDAVSVCTWNNAHVPASLAAIEAGCHVFCEKPMAMNAKEAAELKKAAEKAGKVLGIGFVRRFGKDADFCRELVQNGQLGDIYYARANYVRRNGNPGGWFADKARSGGGPLIDLGVHIIDFVRYIEGNPKPVSVYGATFARLYNRAQLKDKKAYVSAGSLGEKDKCDVEDLASAMIRFDNGSVLTVETSYSLNTGHDSGCIEIFGDKGGVTIDPNVVYHGVMLDRMTDITFPSQTTFDGSEYALEIENFLSAILDGEALRATAEDGVELMKILDAIYESAQTGHEVLL